MEEGAVGGRAVEQAAVALLREDGRADAVDVQDAGVG